jgi:hypothetical protein
MKFFAFLFVVVIISVTSCSTEVELNAPYQSTTVVFGLVNPDFNGDNLINALDTQWIKINRTFLGEGNNNDYAAVRDSSEYHDDDFISKVVQRMNDGEVVEEYPLISKVVSNKDVNGIFYGPEQTLYYFVPPAGGLNQSSEYKILLRFVDGREVSGTTNLVDYATFSWQSPQENATILMANPGSDGNVLYVDPVSVRWYPAKNASLYDVILRFHYTELIYDNTGWIGEPVSTTVKSLDYSLGTVVPQSITSSEALKVEFDGEGFYSFIRNSIPVNAFAKRIIGNYDAIQQRTECFDVLLTIGNEELASYIEVNSPSTTIVQERPTYTNINNGLGLFASRGARKVQNIRLVGVNQTTGTPNQGNLKAFFVSGSTAELNFCDPNPTSDYSCE